MSTPEGQFNQQETVSQFATRVRAKNPGAYDAAPDGDLVDRYLRKHPVYADRVALPPDFKLLRTSSGDSKLDDLYEQAGREHNVDPNLLLEQGRVESVNFNPKYIYQKGATSPKGAGGISQFMPGTAPSYGLRVGNGVDDRYDPAKAIPAQARMMRELLDKHNGDYDAALAAYNSGSGLSTQRALVNRQRNPETRKYVDTITGKVKSLPVLLNDSAPEVSPEEASQPKTGEVAQPNANAFKGGEVVELPNKPTSRRSSPTIQVRARAGDTPETLAARYEVSPSDVRLAKNQIAPVGSQSFGAVGQAAQTPIQPAPVQTLASTQPTPRTLQGTTVRPMRPRQNVQNQFLTQATDLAAQARNLLSQNQPAPFVGVRTTRAGTQATPSQTSIVPGVRTAQAGTQATTPANGWHAQTPAEKVAGVSRQAVSATAPTQADQLRARIRSQVINEMGDPTMLARQGVTGADAAIDAEVNRRLGTTVGQQFGQATHTPQGYADVKAELERLPPGMRETARAGIRSAGSLSSAGGAVMSVPGAIDDGWSWLMRKVGIYDENSAPGPFARYRDELREAGARASATADEDLQNQIASGQKQPLLNQVMEGGISAYLDINTKFKAVHKLLELGGIAATPAKVMALVGGIDNADKGTLETVGGMVDGTIRGKALDVAISRLGTIKGSLATGAGAAAETFARTGNPTEAAKAGIVTAGIGLSPEGVRQDLSPVERNVSRAESLPVDEMLSASEAERVGQERTANESARRGLSNIGEQLKAKGQAPLNEPANEPWLPVEPVKASKTIVRHADPNIDGKPVVGKTNDGRLIVENENNKSGVSIVQNPRTQGNRSAAIQTVREEASEGNNVAENPTPQAGSAQAGSQEVSSIAGRGESKAEALRSEGVEGENVKPLPEGENRPVSVSSKLIDEQGKPITVYHVTDKAFDTFRVANNDIGIHFGDEGTVANRKRWLDKPESATIKAYNLDLKNPIELSSDPGGWGGRVFLNVLHMDGHITDGEYNSLINKLPQKGSTARSVQAIKSLLESKGYDGIIYPNSVEGEGRNSYVAFHPEQVKPAGAGLVPSEGAKQPVSPSIEEPKFLNRVLGKDVGEADVTTKDFLDFVAREVPSSTFNKIAALEPSAFRGSPEKQFSGAITEGLKQAGVAPDKFGTIQTPRALMQLYEKLGDWKSVYGAIQEYATQSQGQKQNATTPIASPISPRIEEPRAQNFTQFATERGLASDYDVLEHGLLGESGSMSRRAKNFQMEKMSERIQQNKQAHNEYEQAILRGEIVDPEGKLTREGLQKEAKEAELEKPRQQLASIEGQIANIENLGTMSHLANGKLKSRYQRTIDIYNKEKAKIFNDHPELSPSVEESSQGEPDLKDIIRDLPPPKAFDKSLPQAPMSKAEAVSNREVNAENIISDAPSFERHIKEKFQLSPEQARAIAAITDARAETWARKNGKDKSEWYKSRIAGVERGGTVADDALLQREGFREASPEERKGLKIPPAWTEVEIASDPNARLLAVGRDAKGRTQRLYSIAHSEAQLVEKFNRQREFNAALPEMMRRIEADAVSGRNKEEASVLRLIAQSGFRVGGEADTGAKIKAYGASTLKPEHVKIDSDTVKFDFIGKLGVRQEHEIKDADLARDLRARQESGNPQLFRTNDRAVRAYLNSISGEKSFKVHDFRTWNATEAARKAIEERAAPTTPEEYWRARDEVGDIAAKKIGDTRTIALDSYIDPFVFEDWRERAGVEANAQRPRQRGRLQAQTSENERSLRDSPLSSFQQEGKGAVEFLKDGRAIIRAFEKADVSTAAHEVAHIFRRDLDGDLLKDTEQWAGVSNGDWTRGAEEKFARGFERYLRDGLAPTEKLKTVFAQFKDWLTNIYQKLKGSEIDVKISPEMRNVFDKLLGKGESNEQNTKAEDRPISTQREVARPEIPRAVAAGTPALSGESERNRSSVPVEDVTGGKVAVTRKEREERGLSPVEQQAYKLAPEAYTEGKSKVESNDIDPRRLAESVANNPKPLSYSETGALIYDRARLKNEQKAIYERINSAADDTGRAEAKDDLARNERDLDLNDQALEKGGREWSMAGQARKAMVKQDYSLAEMVQEYRATTGKEPTLEVRAKLESQAKRIAELEAEMAQKAERDAKREADAALGRIKDDAVRESRRARRATTKQEIDTEWADLKTQFAQARKEIRSGTHPSGLAGLDPEGKLTKIIGQMAKNRVKAGVNTIDGLVDAVHSQVKEFLDDKRAIRDVISGYGKETKPRERLEWEKQLSDLQAQMRELSKQEDVAQGRRESSALKASKTRTQKSIDELNRRIREQDFSKSTRNTIVYDREGLRLRSQLEKVKQEFEVLKYQNSLTRGQRIKNTAVDIANLPRSLKSSIDLSAPRQAAMWLVSHPAEGAKLFFGKQLKAMSEKNYDIYAQELKSDPDFDLMQKSGLAMATAPKFNARLSAREEAFMSKLAGKIPGVSHSERAYTTFIDTARVSWFKQLKTQAEDAASRQGKKVTPEQYKAIAKFVNLGTGRGDLGRGTLNNISPVLNSIFFAPRYAASKIQVFDPRVYSRLPAGARKMAVRQAVQYFGAVATVAMLLKYGFGQKVGTDPDDSDFGKMVIGNTHYDLTNGQGQYIVLASRLFKNAQNKIQGKADEYGKSASDNILRFLRYKLAPLPAAALNTLQGRNAVGEKTSIGKESLDLIVPLFLNDMYEAFQDSGAKGIIKAAPGFVGVGVQTYSPQTGGRRGRASDAPPPVVAPTPPPPPRASKQEVY